MLQTDSIDVYRLGQGVEDVYCLGQDIKRTLDDGMDLYTTGLLLCRPASLNTFAYTQNLHAQVQTALPELEDILTEVGDKSTQNIPRWRERMERQEEPWEQFRPKIMDEFLKHSPLSEDCVSLSQANVCAYSK